MLEHDGQVTTTSFFVPCWEAGDKMNSDAVGGRWEGIRGLRPLLLLASAVLSAIIFMQPARAADTACATVIARVVSIQGRLEVLRSNASDWEKVVRLDTALCQGDRIRTGAKSRAALFVLPETVVRADERTTVALSQTNEGTQLEFFDEDSAPSVEHGPACGKVYVITRFPKRFTPKTRFINAVVEGTEFQLAMRCESTELSVFEGKVLAEFLAQNTTPVRVNSGESVTAGEATAEAVKLIVDPIDAVQWALYYPPILDAKTEPATADDCRSLEPALSHACFVERADQLLRVGRVDEASEEAQQAISADPTGGEAHAILAIIKVVKNDKVSALEEATRATEAAPHSMRAWLALSYAQQAHFQLEAALKSAQQANQYAPDSALTHARVAELLMSLGRISDAEKEAKLAVDTQPKQSRAHLILGFVHLAQINTQLAREDFQHSIELDSSDPLARLGLGLAKIREGHLKEGREELEIAVGLDPTNSLVRSYVGKAYYEENTKDRDQLAETQFTLAKQYDERDPTPWFYDAILKQTQNRPVEALQSLQRSIELNDNRAVYRSKLFLDEDLASRGISQGKLYTELGFSQIGLDTAAQSLMIDPGNASAHRFLADIDALRPRHEIARASELLQTQLRQPPGATPLQQQLANDALNPSPFTGPATVGINEFNSLYAQNRTELQLFGLYGNSGVHGDQAIFNGLSGPISLSLSQLASRSDGYRPNNDDTLHEKEAFLQTQVSPTTGLQFEATSSHRVSGDLQTSFNPDFFFKDLRQDEDVGTARIGFRQIINANSDFLVSLTYRDRDDLSITDDPFVPFSINVRQISRKVEAQYLNKMESSAVEVGGAYFESKGNLDRDFPTFSYSDSSFVSTYHTNAYGYAYVNAEPNLPQMQFGLSYDRVQSSEVGNQEETSPKVGVIWSAGGGLTLRAAHFQVVKRRVTSDQGLEPTQLAGFSQFFDDPNGAKSKTSALAASLRISPGLFAGVEGSYRELNVPFIALSGDIESRRRYENAYGANLYWLPTSDISIALYPRYQRIIGGDTFDKLELVELPVSAHLFLSSGCVLGARLSAVWERGIFDDSGGVSAEGADHFELADFFLGYRLPRRSGLLSIEVTNAFNRRFKFQEIDISAQPRFVPERRVLLRMSIDI